MRPLRGLTWAGSAYAAAVIAVGAALVPITVLVFPLHSRGQLLQLVYLAVLTQVAAFMPIKWRHGSQTVDTMPLVAASILAPGVGPALLGWFCKFDGRWPSDDLPVWKLMFNRGRTAIEFGLPSMALAMMPIPPEAAVPIKTLGLAAGTLLIGYPLMAKAFALADGSRFWSVYTANVGVRSGRSVLILSIGGGALFMVLQVPGGYLMGLGLLGLLFAVRSNMADTQRQQVERIQTLELLAQALDARDPMTELHSQRVSNLASRIAHVLGMSDLEVERIRVAGLLHDIGKIGVPDAILKKPSALEPNEWAAMRRHAELGAEMIGRHSALLPMAPWVRHHHERWDGSGYPAGLRGTDIPMGARIIAVADSFDTMTGPRVYRRSSLSAAEAVANISALSGVLYDELIVNALRQIYGERPLQSGPLANAPIDGARRANLFGLYRSNQKLRLLTSGTAISALGDPLTTVAVTVSAFAITHNGLAVAAAMILRAASTLLAGAVFGGAVDKWPRRQLIVLTDSTQAVMLCCAPILLYFVPPSLFAIVVVLGAASALGQAAREASITAAVPHRQLGTANGLAATGSTLGRSMGYPLAALIIWKAMSTTPLYLVDAGTFLLAAVATVGAGSLGGGLSSRSVTGALRSTLALRHVHFPLLIAGAGGFLVSTTVPVLIVLASELSANGPQTYTVLEIVVTIGMMLGAVAFARFAHRPRVATVAGLVVMGVASLLVSTSGLLFLSAALLFIGSIGNQLYVIGNRTELQGAAPKDRVGSVMASRGVLVQTLVIAGAGAGGLMSAVFGGRVTYGLAGAGMFVLTVVILLFGRSGASAADEVPGYNEHEARPAVAPAFEAAEGT